MSYFDFIQGFIIGSTLIVAIGPQNLFVINQGLKKQFILTVVLFCSRSDSILIIVGINLSNLIINLNPNTISILKILGGIWLAFYGTNKIINIKKLKKLKKKLFLLQLEMLQRNHSRVMDDFCKTYDLQYEDSMQRSEYFNLKWWGDKVSQKDINGINENFKVSFNEKTFYKRDIKFLEYILYDYIKFYGYEFTEKLSKIYLNLLPMKCELLTWKNTLKQKKIKPIFSIPFFYMKRLLLINKLSQKNLEMPHSFGL